MATHPFGLSATPPMSVSSANLITNRSVQKKPNHLDGNYCMGTTLFPLLKCLKTSLYDVVNLTLQTDFVLLSGLAVGRYHISC